MSNRHTIVFLCGCLAAAACSSTPKAPTPDNQPAHTGPGTDGKPDIGPAPVDLSDAAMCAKRDGAGCYGWGQECEAKQPADLDCAARAYRQACALSHAGGCRRAAEMAQDNKGPAASLADIFQWYVAGWNAGDAESAVRAAKLRLAGGVAFADNAAEWDAKLYEAACAQGEQAACVERGIALRGTDAAGNARAQQLAEAACAKDVAAGCNLAGLIASSHDLDKASGFFGRACTGGMPLACASQGEILAGCDKGAPCDRKQAKELLLGACVARVDDACRSLALLYRKGNAADRAAVAPLLDRSCELGNAEACFDASIGAKAPAARTYLERGCTLGDDQSCYAFAAKLQDGVGGAADAARAQDVMAKACGATAKANWGDSCNGWCGRHSDASFCH